MMDLRHLILGAGYRTIQIYKMVGGSKRWPHTIIWEICANTLVDEINYSVLNQERWLLVKSKKLSYVRRVIHVNGRTVDILMAREILKLPRVRGRGGDEADHENHDTFDNTLENLRVATRAQSVRNQNRYGSVCRFKGISKQRNKFVSAVRYNQNPLYIGIFNTDIEAALAYFYAGTQVYGEFFRGTRIPDDEMPSEERQEEIRQSVLSILRKNGVPGV